MKKTFLALLLISCVFCFALIACDKNPADPQTTQLQAPVITAESNVVAWQAVSDTTEYEVFVNGASVGRQAGLSYVLTETAAGDYKVTVRALSEDASFVPSEQSNEVVITVLPGKLFPPVLRGEGPTFSWAAVPFAAKYAVYVDGERVSEQAELSYTLDPAEYRAYSMQVKALPGSTDYTESDLSAEKIYVHAKPKVEAPTLRIDGEIITWVTSENAEKYEVYVDGTLAATVTEGRYVMDGDNVGTHSVYVRAVSADPQALDDNLSETVSVLVEATTDLSASVYVYSKHLEERVGRYALGIADKDNYASLSDDYKKVLDTMMDNYLCNLTRTTDAWSDARWAKYAWKLEEVTYDMTKSWVHDNAKVYRIRLTDGMYLTVAKNNVIGSGDGDYICASEYVENDIWQYWQFIPKEDCKNQYYIYSVGHGYDWGRINDFLVDTSRGNGGAELYPMSEGNEAYFPFFVKNVEGAEFDDIKHNDYSGRYVVSNFKNSHYYAVGDDDLVRVTESDAFSMNGTEVWTLEKVEGKDTYRIRFYDGRYMCMRNYDLGATDTAGAQEFYVYEVAGLKNGFKICGALDSDFCLFTDGDGLSRRFCYSDTETAGKPSRWWNSIDHRNDMGNYWIFTASDGDIPVGRPDVTNEENVFSWNGIQHASAYEVYVNGVLVGTVTDTSYTLTGAEEGTTYSVTVKAITTEDGYRDSVFSKPCVYTPGVDDRVDFAKPIFAYNEHLRLRYALCALGIASKANYGSLSDSYKATLDDYIDNYLCNMVASDSWTDDDYAAFAWMLEEVTYDMTKTWVYADARVYRIRLTDGYYLTAAKNNLIGTGGDYICESEYVENDIWQYWQFIPVAGKKNTYTIYNLGHGFDWGNKTHFVVDSTSADGHAEFYPMDSGNAEWFEFVLSNVEATFADEKHKDYSGDYTVSSLVNPNLYAPGDDGKLQAGDHTADAKTAADVWTLEKVEGKNSCYRIRFSDGKYLCMNGYDLYTTDEAGAQEFYVYEVAGLKNGFRICGALDSDFCLFTDANDGLERRYVYSDGGNGVPSRQWGSVDWRNDTGRYFIFTPEQV